MLKSAVVGAVLVGASLVASGCAPRISPVDFEQGVAAQGAASSWNLAGVEIEIPESMRVNTNSERRRPKFLPPPKSA